MASSVLYRNMHIWNKKPALHEKKKCNQWCRGREGYTHTHLHTHTHLKCTATPLRRFRSGRTTHHNRLVSRHFFFTLNKVWQQQFKINNKKRQQHVLPSVITLKKICRHFNPDLKRPFPPSTQECCRLPTHRSGNTHVEGFKTCKWLHQERRETFSHSTFTSPSRRRPHSHLERPKRQLSHTFHNLGPL